MKALRCRLVDRGGRVRTGAVVGLSGGGDHVLLEVGFGPGEEVVLPLGSEVELALFGPDLYRPHPVPARPVRRQKRGGRESYTFAVEARRRLELELVIGGRGAPRVQPDPGQLVSVQLILPGDPEPVTCPLHDASTSGLAVEVGWADEKRLVDAHEFMVLLQLPGDEEPQPIPSRVRRRAMQGDRIVYGIAFDPGESPASNPTLQVLAGWVEERFQALTGGVRVQRRPA